MGRSTAERKKGPPGGLLHSMVRGWSVCLAFIAGPGATPPLRPPPEWPHPWPGADPGGIEPLGRFFSPFWEICWPCTPWTRRRGGRTLPLPAHEGADLLHPLHPLLVSVRPQQAQLLHIPLDAAHAPAGPPGPAPAPFPPSPGGRAPPGPGCPARPLSMVWQKLGYSRYRRSITGSSFSRFRTKLLGLVRITMARSQPISKARG